MSDKQARRKIDLPAAPMTKWCVLLTDDGVGTITVTVVPYMWVNTSRTYVYVPPQGQIVKCTKELSRVDTETWKRCRVVSCCEFGCE